MRKKEEIIAMLVTLSECKANDECPCMHYDDCTCTDDGCVEFWEEWLEKNNNN